METSKIIYFLFQYYEQNNFEINVIKYIIVIDLYVNSLWTDRFQT